ncbi:hypothetical protein BCU71_19380 [Vibrio lentus]|uniref:hypothetical protein n=1 Tax=Vibrio lentus TaxID=136468 RepID=UPI000C85E1EA|nr:hypothetical protein [Vibrio lentus]PMH28903.1 hypothetical protein BCU71_19380 [Vibrio lentus]PMK68434.1 hypothetical protein BCT93_18350 [Vibrio lentus]
MKKLILGKIGFLLSLLRYRKKKDPFKDFQNFNPAQTTEVSDKTFLVVPIRVSPTSNLFEGLIGYAMRLRGYKVYSLMDGGGLKFSDNSNVNSNAFISNSLSVFEQNRFYRVFGFTPLFFDEIVDKKEIKKIHTEIDSLSMKKLISFTYKGVNVGVHAKYGVMRYLKIETILSEHEELLREFLLTSIYTSIATNQAIKMCKPDRALISHGCYSTWGAALETLRVSNVETSVWGRGYIGNGNVLISHNESYLFEYIYEDNSLWENNILTNEQAEKVKNYYRQKRIRGNSVDGLSYYKEINHDNIEEFEFILRKNKEYKSSIGIFPNIPWDGTMFSASESFPNMRAFIRAFIGLAIENKNIHYIIRSHPAEEERKGNESRETFKDILFSIVKEIPDNITYIEPKSQVTSYQVSNIVDAALMFGSTLSLEFSVAALPVIQVGLTNTSNKGIVYEPKNIEELKITIDLVISNNYVYPSVMHERAIKYAYHWVYRKHIPETLVNLKELEFENYKINSVDELALNNNPTLDFICDRIETRTPVIIDG